MTIHVTNHLPYQQLDLERSSTQYLQMGDSNFFTSGGAPNSSAGAVLARIDLESNGILQKIFTKGDTDSAVLNGGAFVELFVNSSNQVVFYTYHLVVSGMFAFKTKNQFVSTTTLSTATNYEIFCTFDSTNATASERIKMWINGSSETASSSVLTTQARIYDDGNPARVGVGWDGTNPVFAFDGDIYNLSIFSPTAVQPIPALSDVRHSNGEPKDTKDVTGIISVLDCDCGVPGSDGILSTDWTEVNSPVCINTTLDGII